MAVAFLNACSNSGADYRPIVDQPTAAYETDLAACQALARERGYLEGAATEAGIGGAVGGGVGLLTGDPLTGLATAAVGAAIGATVGAIDTLSDREDIVKTCLEGRGQRVVG